MSARCFKLAVAVALLAFGSRAEAQSPQPASTASAAQRDQVVIATIVMSSVAEVQLCELALAKSENLEVRSFCLSAVNEHARTALAGMQLAKTLGAADVKLVPLAGTPATLNSLTQYSGHDFDRQFLLTQIQGRENDQDELRYATQVETDTAVKRYENAVLPNVQNDLARLESALRTISADQP